MFLRVQQKINHARVLLSGASGLIAPGWIFCVSFLCPCVLLAASVPEAEGLAHTDLAESLRQALEGDNVFVAFTIAWLGGLLTSLTPCVYPMIPITIRYFGGMKDVRRSRVIVLALTYVLGMALLYGVLGTISAASNVVFGSVLANTWVLVAIALFCALMGFSMLGFFSIQLPGDLGARLSAVGGDSVAGAFAMGLVSGVIAAPCTGPVLAVILTLVALSGKLFQGFLLMVVFALGLGLPFLILALSAGNLQRLPASGVWMQAVKSFLAALMFVVALYFLSIVWPVIAAFLGYLPGFQGLALGLIALGLIGLYAMGSAPLAWTWKGKEMLVTGILTLGLSMAVLGVPEEAKVADKQAAEGVVWLTSHERGLAEARSLVKPVMIDFTADWCQACKELDKKTFSDPRVGEESRRFVSIKLDATEVDDAMNGLFERYGILGLPTVVFLDSEGKILKEPRVTGFVGPQAFVQSLQGVE